MENKPAIPPKRSLAPLIAIVPTLATLTALCIPNFTKPRTRACQNACIANLKQIDGAIQQWALENKVAGSNTVNFLAAQDFMKGSVLPACPANGTYTVTTVSRAPICSMSALGHSL